MPAVPWIFTWLLVSRSELDAPQASYPYLEKTFLRMFAGEEFADGSVVVFRLTR